MLKTRGSRVRTSVWTKFFLCLFVCLFGEWKIKGFRGICALRVPFSSFSWVFSICNVIFLFDHRPNLIPKKSMENFTPLEKYSIQKPPKLIIASKSCWSKFSRDLLLRIIHLFCRKGANYRFDLFYDGLLQNVWTHGKQIGSNFSQLV